jgi:hypothetical protein
MDDQHGRPVGRLANLVIAGVPKAGTGALFAYLAQHPDVCGSDEKETGYFNHYNPRRHSGPPPAVESYARHFAHCSGERYLLEATPTYSYGGKPVVAAIRAVLDRPKIILLLRNPTERLWSAYTFQRSLGTLGGIGSFEQYLDVVRERRRDADDLVPRDGLSGLYIGFYAEYLADWLDEFGDEDLRIVFAEDMRRDARDVVVGLCAWLGIDTDVVASLDLGARNVTRHPRSTRLAESVNSLRRGSVMALAPPAVRSTLRRAYLRVNSGGQLAERLDPALRRQVDDLYRASNQDTAAMLAARGYRDLPAWLLTA